MMAPISSRQIKILRSYEKYRKKLQLYFTPPRAPHFGRLWEAAVKFFKHHFRRIVWNAFLTFEKFYIICTQIEAILNSRPLIPLSEDPSDFHPNTRTLIGDSLRTNLEPDFTEAKLNRLSRFQLLERILTVHDSTFGQDGPRSTYSSFRNEETGHGPTTPR